MKGQIEMKKEKLNPTYTIASPEHTLLISVIDQFNGVPKLLEAIARMYDLHRVKSSDHIPAAIRKLIKGEFTR
jgi:hypothetical protein